MDCNRLARWYRWLEYLTFGPALEQRRLEYLHQLPNARNVLILGDGDGRFTASFLATHPSAQITSIEMSSAMMRLAERRIRALHIQPERARLLVADATAAHLDGPYDLVVTHFFLDCFTTAQTERMIERVSAAMQPDATWLLSEFQIPPRGFMRPVAMFVVRSLYFAFRLLTGLATTCLPNYATALASSGFHLQRHKSALGGLLVSQLWQKRAA